MAYVIARAVASMRCFHGFEYQCSRCGGCYVCEHESFERNGQWFWICRSDGAVKLAKPETR